MVALTILAIALAFIALFVLPFFFVSSKVFRDKDLIFKVYASIAIGLFTSIAIVYLLIGLGMFTKISFLAIYIPIIALVNFYFLRKSKWKDFNFNIKSHWIIPSILLIIAFCLGFYLRFYEPITNVSLAGSDPWAHLLWAKQVILGDVLASGKWGWDYPKGLHTTLSLIHFYSGMKIYSVLRFAGALFGVVSIGAVYCLVSYIGGRYAGAFASLAYSGFQYTSSSSILIARQTLTMPEPLAFILVPLILLFALEIVKDLHREKIQKKNIALFIIITILFLIHPLTLLYVFYLLFLLFILALIFYKNIRRNIKSILLLILLFPLGIWITIIYYQLITVAFHQIYAILFNKYPFLNSFASSLNMITISIGEMKISISQLLEPTRFKMSIHLLFVLLLSFGIALYGTFKRKLLYAFIGASGILFSFIDMTGCLTLGGSPSALQRPRSLFSLLTSCIFGIAIVGFANRKAIGEILKKIGDISRYARWLSKISQSVLYTLYCLLLGIVVSGWMCWGIFNRMNYAHPLRMAAPIVLIVGITVFIIIKISSMRKNRLTGKKWIGTSDQRIFKVIVAISFFLVLFTPAHDPYTNYVVHHGYEDFVTTTLNICDEFPLNKVAIYSAPIRINREEPIIYPDGSFHQLRELAKFSPSKYVPERERTFIYIEKNIYPTRRYYEGNESIETMEEAKEWISNYKENHVDISVYYESKDIIVYLIEKG